MRSGSMSVQSGFSTDDRWSLSASIWRTARVVHVSCEGLFGEATFRRMVYECVIAVERFSMNAKRKVASNPSALVMSETWGR